LKRYWRQNEASCAEQPLAKDSEAIKVRWGHSDGRLVLGGRRVVVRRPRVRQNGKEVPLPSWQEFADEDPLEKHTVEQMMVGVSTRNCDRAVE
jgi:putative transposase